MIHRTIEQVTAAPKDREHGFEIRPDVWDRPVPGLDGCSLLVGDVVALNCALTSVQSVSVLSVRGILGCSMTRHHTGLLPIATGPAR